MLILSVVLLVDLNVFIYCRRNSVICSYYKTPDYDKITALMRSALISNNAAEYPYDWEHISLQI